MITVINIRLCRYMLNFSNMKARTDLGKIMKEIGELWKMAGSKGKRFAEIEHLVFVTDALTIEKNAGTTSLRDNVVNMKKELEKLISNR